MFGRPRPRVVWGLQDTTVAEWINGSNVLTCRRRPAWLPLDDSIWGGIGRVRLRLGQRLLTANAPVQVAPDFSGVGKASSGIPMNAPLEPAVEPSGQYSANLFRARARSNEVIDEDLAQ